MKHRWLGAALEYQRSQQGNLQQNQPIACATNLFYRNYPLGCYYHPMCPLCGHEEGPFIEANDLTSPV